VVSILVIVLKEQVITIFLSPDFMFYALFIECSGESPPVTVREITGDVLPDGDVTVSVLYSSLNYKDGLAVTGTGRIIKGEYPFIPGIDLVGEVVSSDSERFSNGDLVIGTGSGLGENRWGGYSQIQRVDGSRLIMLPGGMDVMTSMVSGTAGLTAMLSVMALEAQGVKPDGGEIVVTGASGGVGSTAVALLASYGYPVVASTGSRHAYTYLKNLGAQRVIDRDELAQGPHHPLDTGQWAAAVDTVGSTTLSALISQTKRHGAIAACGLVAGHTLQTTVFPFILRGISLLGIDSNTCPNPVRSKAWDRLSDVLSPEIIKLIKAEIIPLSAVPVYAAKITGGAIQGRIVVDVNI